MARIVELPQLSPTMEEGVITRWAKKKGEHVSRGDTIAEVETDKANMDFVAEEDGFLLEQLVNEGDTVKLGAPVAVVGKPEEDIALLLEQARARIVSSAEGAEASRPAAIQPTAREPAPTTPPPSAVTTEQPPEAAAPEIAPPGPGLPKPVPPEAAVSEATQPPRAARRILASPLARTLAAEHGIDLGTLKGTGPDGRVVERDVRAAIDSRRAPMPAPAPAPRSTPMTPPEAHVEEFTDRTLSPMRKTIARRLLAAKQEIPHFYLSLDCNAGALMRFYDSLQGQSGANISLNDVFVKIAALGLRQVPELNVSFLGDRIRSHGHVNIGVAVAVEDGLTTVVVHDADIKGLAAIASTTRDLVARARSRRLASEEMTGSTFTVSNLGMYGIDSFYAVVNPPEAAILAVGAVRKAPAIDANGQVIAGQRVGLTLSCDHRAVDGAAGSRYLGVVAAFVAKPVMLAL
ncbi:MAG: dihydrolipoamide acetyltransferase family protein [Pseudomonadota bacterium]